MLLKMIDEAMSYFALKIFYQHMALEDIIIKALHKKHPNKN